MRTSPKDCIYLQHITTTIRFIIERTHIHSVHAQDNYALDSQQRFIMILSVQYALNSFINRIIAIVKYSPDHNPSNQRAASSRLHMVISLRVCNLHPHVIIQSVWAQWKVVKGLWYTIKMYGGGTICTPIHLNHLFINSTKVETNSAPMYLSFIHAPIFLIVAPK